MTEPTGRLLADEEAHGADAQRMVDDQLVSRGLTDERVLRAMRSVPRHRFVPSTYLRRAYDDGALPTHHNQTISQPYMVAMMTAELAPGSDGRVLEVGTGSGYQAAVLAMLVREVVTIERDADLAEQARRTLAALGVDNVAVHVGDGTLGVPSAAPYDGILVTAGAPEVPKALSDQLADGGRLVIPVGSRDGQDVLTVERRGDQLLRRARIPCRFVPLVGVEGWAD